MRLIDADELWELLDNGYDVDLSEAPETKAALLEMINYQETIDAVPIVRCKDCKWYKEEKGIIGLGCCIALKPAGDGQFICWGNWFCGDGKVKDDSN